MPRQSPVQTLAKFDIKAAQRRRRSTALLANVSVWSGLTNLHSGLPTDNVLLDTAFSQCLVQRLIQGVLTGAASSLIHA